MEPSEEAGSQTDRSTSPLSRKSIFSQRQRWRPTRKSIRNFVVRCLIVVIVSPGVLAGVGALIDRRVFGSTGTHFHVQYLPFSALVASPYVLLRWTVADAPRYVHSVEFVIYAVQTGGILAAYSSALVGGKEPYHVLEHVKDFFSAEGRFQKIKTENDVFGWLESVVEKFYNNTNPGEKMHGRQMAGRMHLMNEVRLRQNRVTASECKGAVRSFRPAGFRDCYLKFSGGNEDRSPYSYMNFTWTNMPYKTYDGTVVDMSSEESDGDFATYPMAGYWTLFPPDCTYKLAVDQVRAMKQAGWIDQQTRLIALDFAFQAPQMDPPLWGTADFKVEITAVGQFVPFGPTLTLNILPEIENVDIAAGATDVRTLLTERIQNNANETKPLDSGLADPLNRCLPFVGEGYFKPFYLGMLSPAIYTIFVHVFLLRRDWRKYLRTPFSYTELFWVVMITISLALRLSGDAKNPCNTSIIVQEPFVSATTDDEIFHSAVMLRYELLTMGKTWQDSRHLLAMALFLHFFNFLKFLVHFANLGTLVRTLQASATELASFSLSFFVIFMAFVTMFYTLFSLQAKDFSTFLRSVSTLWLGMLGEISLTDQLWNMKEWAVPAIILFTFISVFVLLTLIVAIISNAHERIKNDAEVQRLRNRNLLRTVTDAFKNGLRPVGYKVAPDVSMNGALKSADGEARTAAGDHERMKHDDTFVPSFAIQKKLQAWRHRSRGDVELVQKEPNLLGNTASINESS